MLKLSATVLLCLLMIGCAAKSSHQLTGQARAAISPAEVVVFSEPPQQYSEIAIVTATSGGSITPANKGKTADVLNWLKAEAAALGANGIILTSLEEDVEMDRVPTTTGTQSSHNNVTKFYQIAQATAVYVE
ncbi:DUF4156 domain-containing protein [Arsukibacterium indicum]|uniref:DUF4156 domain-containing protein n=1 Tax=Arsukibacterium indicum TaxID=2848612 RepID=A0ABS6MLU5_9GAMM|nr:DUF4156 domain-containing protein [Arsukibacterium indicum]MBV2129334.1 DUF4156 domain-containing protein [Arsukibacterium indicum]